MDWLFSNVTTPSFNPMFEISSLWVYTLLDLDGDGYLYYIITEPSGYAPDYGTPMDNADYEAWLDSYIGGAAVLDIPYVPLTAETIAAIG